MTAQRSPELEAKLRDKAINAIRELENYYLSVGLDGTARWPHHAIRYLEFIKPPVRRVHAQQQDHP